MRVKEKKHKLKVTSCEKIEDHYCLTYESEEALTYREHDLLTVKDSDNNRFTVEIKNAGQEDVLEVYMSIQYETTVIGEVEVQLIFSPLESVEGAAELMKYTRGFPACHYDKIIDYQFENNIITLIISLEYNQLIMKLQLLDVIENKLVDYQDDNVIVQLTLWYVDEGIEVEVYAMNGLDGTVVCKRVKAELIKD